MPFKRWCTGVELSLEEEIPIIGISSPGISFSLSLPWWLLSIANSSSALPIVLFSITLSLSFSSNVSIWLRWCFFFSSSISFGELLSLWSLSWNKFSFHFFFSLSLVAVVSVGFFSWIAYIGLHIIRASTPDIKMAC